MQASHGLRWRGSQIDSDALIPGCEVHPDGGGGRAGGVSPRFGDGDEELARRRAEDPVAAATVRGDGRNTVELTRPARYALRNAVTSANGTGAPSSSVTRPATAQPRGRVTFAVNCCARASRMTVPLIPIAGCPKGRKRKPAFETVSVKAPAGSPVSAYRPSSLVMAVRDASADSPTRGRAPARPARPCRPPRCRRSVHPRRIAPNARVAGGLLRRDGLREDDEREEDRHRRSPRTTSGCTSCSPGEGCMRVATARARSRNAPDGQPSMSASSIAAMK